MSNTKYFDKNLNPVLEASTANDLAPLVEYLKKKFSEELTFHPEYIKHNPDHTKYTDIIAKEIREMGGNSISNVCRGRVGPSYYEIVCDVADKVKATYKNSDEISVIEKSILEAILKKALDVMSEEDKAKMLKDLELNGANLGGVTLTSLVALFEAGGFYSYQLAVIVANQVAHLVLGHGLSFAANAALTKSLSIMAGPIGWAVCGIWATLDISGPAYSVTVPCVVHIAVLRMKSKYPRCLSCSIILSPQTSAKFCASCLERTANFFKQVELENSLECNQQQERKENSAFTGMFKILEKHERKMAKRAEMDEKRRGSREIKAQIRKKKKQKKATATSSKSTASKTFSQKLNKFVTEA